MRTPTIVSVFGVEPSRIGGTETFARELSLQLGERGWTSVLCFLSEPPAEVGHFLKLANVEFEVIEHSFNANWSATISLARIIRRYRPEILHLHFTGFLGTYPWVARIFGTSKVFFSDHSSRPKGYVPSRASLWRRIIVRTINWPLTKVICVSKYGYACMSALDVLPAKRFQLIYNGVDLTRVSRDADRAKDFRRRYAIPEGRSLVVQVSWIIPEKGIPDLLRAAQIVLSENDNVQFVLVGEGAYREEYMKEAVRMGLGDHFTWTGAVQDPFGEGVFDAADIVCQLSQWEELFGWMIAEGMAHGKPVVASRVGGIPELVTDHETGFLVNRDDTQEMAERILTLLSDAKLRERLGRAGYEATATKFDLHGNVQQLLGVYGI